MYKILALIIGGASGTLLRYLISSHSMRLIAGAFPWGTLIVNLLGSFLIGFCFGIFEKGHLNSNIKLFLFVGLFGGFTTFSSYALESLNLIKTGNVKYAVTYIIASNILGLILVFLGYILAKVITTVSQ
jgi:CrcB protein